MASLNPKSIERIVSQRAFQMSSSFPCQICVVGFLGGVCLTSFFLAAITCFGSSSVASILFSTGISAFSSNSSMAIGGDCNGLLKGEAVMHSIEQNTVNGGIEDKVSSLYKAWNTLLIDSGQSSLDKYESVAEAPPHLENCRLKMEMNHRLDTRLPNGSFPPWTIWKGVLDELSQSVPAEQHKYHRDLIISEGAYPPWISGSDAENYPLTRKVQKDLWLHQHPPSCSDPGVKFLLADWERLPGFGIGAQLAGMCGLLAIAVNEKRVLVMGYYNRADHDGCEDSSRASWSCYFSLETSAECRKRAFELMHDKLAWEKGIITGKNNYTSRDIWTGRTPRAWGKPWYIIQPTTEVNGSLIIRHRKMDRRWWRAQAVRYLMRFQSEYTCNLMNTARHTAFGWEAAKMVLSSPYTHRIQSLPEKVNDMERFVWSNHKPWVPRPVLSMHVRMGDKACEMKVVDFEHYMKLAERVRRSFPDLKTVWLSTEMQDVIDQSKSYPHWKFYYTNVARQTGNMTMATYESSLGRETSTNYPLVNFLMATEADFFIGALGSTWCFLIDGMRNTGGKVMSGYLSVNKDRFW